VNASSFSAIVWRVVWPDAKSQSQLGRRGGSGHVKGMNKMKLPIVAAALLVATRERERQVEGHGHRVVRWMDPHHRRNVSELGCISKLSQSCMNILQGSVAVKQAHWGQGFRPVESGPGDSIAPRSGATNGWLKLARWIGQRCSLERLVRKS
jgi:hypothetical protein